jgi:hypothetical protein
MLTFLFIYLACGAVCTVIDVLTAYVRFGSVTGWAFSHAPENVSAMIQKYGPIEVVLLGIVVLFDVVAWPYLVAEFLQNLRNRGASQ